MDDKDVAQIQDMIAKGVVAGLAAVRMPQGNSGRSPAEVGSPEFAEDRTQINSLNNKWIFESALDRYYSRSARSDDHYADLQSRGLDALTESLNLTKKVNQAFLQGVEDGRRIRDQWNYITAYDLSNPATTAPADNLRAGSVPQNRAIDTATAQSTLNNTTLQTAIEAAVANALTGTVPTLEAAVGAAVAAALINTPVKPAA